MLTETDQSALRDQVRTRLRETPYTDLSLHLVSAHCNGAGLANTEADTIDMHEHEHDGPGTIRNHPRKDLFWDEEKVVAILIEEALHANTLTEALEDIDWAMTRPDLVSRMGPTEHLHGAVLDENTISLWDGQPCPNGPDCADYPRAYDVVVTRTPEREFREAVWSDIATEDLDRTAALNLTHLALAQAIEALVPQAQSSHIAASALHSIRAAQARLHTSPGE